MMRRARSLRPSIGTCCKTIRINGEHTVSSAAAGSPRWSKRALLIGNDFCILSLALAAAYYLRLGFVYVPASRVEWAIFLAAPVIGVSIFYLRGLYRLVTRYIGARGGNANLHHHRSRRPDLGTVHSHDRRPRRAALCGRPLRAHRGLSDPGEPPVRRLGPEGHPARHPGSLRSAHARGHLWRRQDRPTCSCAPSTRARSTSP